MANKTISQLVSGSTPLSGSELIEIEQNGQSRKVPVRSIDHDVLKNAPDLDIDGISEDSRSPSGLVDVTESTISFVKGTRTFSISPASSSFSFYIKGRKFTKTTTQSVQISDDEGTHFIFFNADGDLVSSTTFAAVVVTDLAIVTMIYWDKDNQEDIYYSDERHGLVMDGVTHAYLHFCFGTAYQSGLDLANVNSDASGSLDTSAQFSVSAGIIWDEDFMVNTLPLDVGDNWPVYYKIGPNGYWRMNNSTTFPVITSGSGRLAYNNFNGTSWKLTEITDRNFVLCHVFATNDVSRFVIAVVGQNEYGTLVEASQAALDEIVDLTTAGMPFVEFTPVASFIFQTQNSFSNTPKAIVRANSNGDDYVDFRGLKGGPAARNAITNHGGLAGLSNDDHLQYMRVDGSRAFNSTVNGVTPSAADNLSTKRYVDDRYQVFHIRDEKASGTDGGTFTSGSWQTRTLNTVKTNEIIGASLSSNQITLPAGTYEIEAFSIGYRCELHKTRLRNISDSSDLLIGSSERSYTTGRTSSKSKLRGRFTIAASKTIELQHRCSSTYSTEGYGVACSFGVVEVYSDIIIRKINS